MGSFLFKWAHPAEEVYVTGTFDDWKKSEKLDKVGTQFEKNVTLPDSSDKILYKFVVDGEWVVDPTAPKESDENGHENNVLTTERIIAEAPATAAIMSNIAPEATTAELAATVPVVEKKTTDPTAAVDAPGAFPETPAGDVTINPMPAADGAVNPIQLAPGEKIPDNVNAESTESNVKLDPESYEKSDTLPGGVHPFTSSAAPEATTAALAAEVPKEPTVPAVVKDSQEKAGAEPEASANTEEVKEKAAVETELKEKLMEAPTTSEGTAGVGTEKTEDVVTPGEAGAVFAAAATAAGTAAVAGAVAAKDAAVEKVYGTTDKEEPKEVAPEVPVEVKESIIEAGKAPEAAGNTKAVEQKAAIEAELIKETTATDAPKPGDIPRTEKAEETKTETPETSEPTAGAPVETPVEDAKAQTNGTPENNGATKTNGTTETNGKTETNGAQADTSKPVEASATKQTETTATPEKKKKNRISAIIGKIKDKMHK